MIYLICTPESRGRGIQVYILGRPLVSVLQLLNVHVITDHTINDCYKGKPSREKEKFYVNKNLRIILGCNIFDRSQVYSYTSST